MPQYRQFQPETYRPEMRAYWYFDRWPYLKFMLREASSVFVAWFAVVILLQLKALISGPSAFESFQRFMATPAVLVLNVVAFVFVCFHAITWFVLVPRVMARQVLQRPTPDLMSAAPNFGIRLLTSVIVALFALRII